MTPRYVWVIETDRCVGCRTCMIGCRMENEVVDGEFRMRVLNAQNTYIQDQPTGTYPNLKEDWLPVPCQHCSTPSCVDVCPTGASHVDETGLVMIDESKCIGCHYCIWACPYDARFFDEREGKADKCTMCKHRLDKGEQPICVQPCSGRCLHVGDINDPESEVSKLIAGAKTYHLIPEQGTNPAAYYI